MGTPPQPRYPRCNIMVPWRVLNKRHLTTSQCAKGAEQKRQQMAEEDLRESAGRAFQDYGGPLEMVTSFKYLGQVLTAAKENWPEVVGNLRKARKSWSWIARILGWEGANPRVSRMFLKAVVQAVLLFMTDTWVLIPCIGRPLGCFQHKVAK